MKVWSILIATVFERSDELVRLLNRLVGQVVQHGDKVELFIAGDDRTLSIGKKRQKLLESAKGEYVSFIDDDDLVPIDYVKKILPHLRENIDYVGFKVKPFLDSRPDKLTFHSLAYDGWFEDKDGYYRDVSHLNPVRKSIALKSTFIGGRGEDKRWADGVRELKHELKEYYIDEVMYEYHFDSKKSVGRKT